MILSLPIRYYSIWLAATLFSFLQFFLQIVCNTMTQGLTESFQVTPSALGLLSSAFFYPFIAVQIPCGYLLERYSKKLILGLSASLCTLSCFCFAISPNLDLAILSRILMGLGSGFGFLGMLSLTRFYFPIKYFSLMVGLSELIALLSTAASEHMMTLSVLHWGWRMSMLGIGFFALAITSILFWLVPASLENQNKSPQAFLPQFLHVISNRYCLYAGLFGCGMFAVVTSFSALWGLDFLSYVYQYSLSKASLGISAVFVGIALGCPIIGFLSAKIHRKTSLMLLCSFFALLITVFLIFPLFSYSYFLTLFLLFVLGFLCSSYFLCYEISTYFVAGPDKGMAMAVVSMMVMMGALVLQPIMGYILQASGFSVFALAASNISAFQKAMLVLLIIQFSALLAVIFLRRARLVTNQSL